MDDSKHLLVMDLVVLFYQRQELAVKHHWMLLVILHRLLRQDSTHSIVQTVGFNLEGF